MRLEGALKVCARVLAWAVGCLFALALLWLAANRLLDERPDPRRDVFLRPGSWVPDAENLAVGIAGLGAPSGADFMAFGAEVRKLYEARATWPDIQRKIHGPGELKLSVKGAQIECWVDPDWDGWSGFKECLSFDQAPKVLAQNRELLERYKALYRLNRNAGFGFLDRELITLTRLAVAEMRLDMKRGRHEAAYAKWRDHFRFARNHLHGQGTWVSRAVGMVDLGLAFPVIEDLLVMRPSLTRIHSAELREVLHPEGVGLIDPEGVARAEYLQLERFFETPYTESEGFQDTFEWLAWKLGQRNRTLNRYLAYSIDYTEVLRRPWAELPGALSSLHDRYASPGWRDLIDPFGYALLRLSTDWQRKPPEMLRQTYILDGRLRLATLVVRIARERIKDEGIPAFLENAAPELVDPFSNRPMRWDAKNGRIYFISSDDGCDISPFRVPVWDAKSSRRPPKHVEWTIC